MGFMARLKAAPFQNKVKVRLAGGRLRLTAYLMDVKVFVGFIPVFLVTVRMRFPRASGSGVFVCHSCSHPAKLGIGKGS
jgi:hypothetical protein